MENWERIFLKVVTAEVSKHCRFMVYHLLILLGRTPQSARVKGFEAWYPKLKGKFTLPLFAHWSQGQMPPSVPYVQLFLLYQLQQSF